MAEALRLAARIPRRPWPNPPVGALVVRDHQVVGRGAHHGAGADHAEVIALREAGPRALGATLYCTLEPCNHHGRTPPCAPLVASSGITRLVVGVADPNPAVCGGGLARVREAGVEVHSGVMGEDALELIWPFVVTRAFERPFVLLKTATSLDGFFAPHHQGAPPGEPTFLTGPAARQDVHRLRRWCDMVVVGERTMQADHPRLDGRMVPEGDSCPGAEPLPAYVDTDLSLQQAWAKPHWIFAGARCASATQQHGIERRQGTVVLCQELDGHVAPASLVAEFQRRGGHCLMVEGGPTLAAAFLRANVVDRWVSYVAPIVLGAGVTWPGCLAAVDRADVGPTTGEPASRSSYHLTRSHAVGPDLKSVFDRQSFPETVARLSDTHAGSR